jgi:assimilatory nitrate reductase catalytic subunit
MVGPMFALCGAPLWSAGHPPHTGGDLLSPSALPISNIASWALSSKLRISPRVGGMSGRTEGGDVERYAANENVRKYA